GLNSDASVRRLKGKERPIQNELARSEVLAALEAVDLVVGFPQDTPLELIRRVGPTVLIKGGDYRPGQGVGRELVEENGAEEGRGGVVDGVGGKGGAGRGEKSGGEKPPRRKR